MQLAHLRVHLRGQLACEGDERGVLVRSGGGGGQHAAEIFVDHCDRAAQQVAEVVGEVGIDPRNQRFVGERAIRAERYLTQEKVANRVHAIARAELDGIDHIALRLAHLAAVQYEPAVAEDLLGQRFTKGHEHNRPDDGMEAHNLLADDMHIRRPELAVERIVFASPPKRGNIVA
ncbi:hypothetical protein SDC9_137166 [bioreactor metagenome]|uniref:Uncharacterized protein n=1 Tax=bioreactor metagenome TaxID=1076179 RepID=A0A645DKS9_9ZZZZ